MLSLKITNFTPRVRITFKITFLYEYHGYHTLNTVLCGSELCAPGCQDARAGSAPRPEQIFCSLQTNSDKKGVGYILYAQEVLSVYIWQDDL